MNKSYLAVALAVLLPACAAIRVGDKGYIPLVIKANPQAPNVTISDDSIVVDQEPIVLKSVNAAILASNGEKLTTISWALPLISNDVFESDAIDILPYDDPTKPPQGKTCGPPLQGGKVFACSYITPAIGTKYKYTIQVTRQTPNSAEKRQFERLDPTIWN